jgi:hypothetical protein
VEIKPALQRTLCHSADRNSITKKFRILDITEASEKNIASVFGVEE